MLQGTVEYGDPVILLLLTVEWRLFSIKLISLIYSFSGIAARGARGRQAGPIIPLISATAT